MRIALLAPLISPIREPQIGGVATLLTDLAAGLEEAGHDVHLYAASGSHVDGLTVVDTGVDAATLAGTLFRPLEVPSEETVRRSAPAWAAFEAAYARIAPGRYDVVHNHAFDAPAIELAGRLPQPVVHTLHLPPDPFVSEALHRAARSRRPPVVAAVSPSQRRGWERHNHVDVLLPAGIPTARIPWSADCGPTLLFAGRISPEKGVLEAVEIARACGRELVIAGGRYDPAYAAAAARATASAGNVTIAGSMPRTALWELMAGSAAFVFPIRWQEPFGMVSAEAQAAGCPVIGFRGGALQDVVLDGRTGAVVEPGDVAGATRALARLDDYDRNACRTHAEDSLDVGPMLRAHVELYERIIRG